MGKTKQTQKIFEWTLLKEVKSMPAWLRFDDDIIASFEGGNFPQAFERAKAAQMFFFRAGKEKENWATAAYLRAGLVEFKSLEEFATKDWRSESLPGKPPMLADSCDPLVVFMNFMRNINVHVTRSEITRISANMIWGREDCEPMNFNIDVEVLVDDFEDQMKQDRDLQIYFNLTDLSRICLWVRDNQCAFGIGQIFQIGLNRFLRSIAVCYNKALNLTP